VPPRLTTRGANAKGALSLHAAAEGVDVDQSTPTADVYTVENVQRRFTKRLPGRSCLSYAERRLKLCLLTLELPGIYSDLIMFFGNVKLEFGDLF